MEKQVLSISHRQRIENHRPKQCVSLIYVVIFSLLSGLFFTTTARAENVGRPLGSPVQDADGNLYGVTRDDGNFSAGTIYKIKADGGYTVLHHINPAEEKSVTALVLRPNGGLYGMTHDTVFRIERDGSNLRTVHQFTGEDGFHIADRLALASNGDIYGYTVVSDATARLSTALKTVYRIDSSDNYIPVHAFSAADGNVNSPQFRLSVGSDGSVYGIKREGGQDNAGTIYKITPQGNYATVFEFGSVEYPIGPPAHPQPQDGLLVQDDGLLIGTAAVGGFQPIVYKIGTQGAFTPQIVPPSDVLITTPISASDGNLYAAALDGNSFFRAGSIYRVNSVGDHDTLNTQDTNFTGPSFALQAGTDGLLYGAASTESPVPALGSIYSVAKSGEIRIVHRFGGVNAPSVTLTAGSNNPVAPGEQVPLTATVSGNSPSGTVSFLDGDTLLGTAQLQSDAASFTATFEPGSHTLSARYEGDQNNTATVSSTVSLVVATGPRTPPLVSYAVKGPQGKAEWYTDNVTLEWTVTEQSGWPVTSAEGCTSLSLTEESKGTTYTCQAASAGGMTTQSVTIKIDKSAPDLQCPADVNVTQGQPIALGSPTVTDSIDPAPTVSNNAPKTYSVGKTTVTWSAVDAAGHEAKPCTQIVTVASSDNDAPRARDDRFVLRANKFGAYVPAPGVLANDRAANGKNALTVAGASATEPRIITLGRNGGSVALYADGHFVFTPRSKHTHGAYRFNYQTSDGSLISSPATVTLFVIPLRSSADHRHF